MQKPPFTGLLGLVFWLLSIAANAQVNDASTQHPSGINTETSIISEDIPTSWQFTAGTAAMLSFSGVNVNTTAEAKKGRHAFYLGPKISVAQQYLPSKAPIGLVSGYKVFFNKHAEPRQFNFFINLDYQLQYHKAFRTSTELPKKYNKLHELNAGYGLQYNISRHLAVNNVIGFGRYLEVFNNPRTGTKTNFDGWNRILKVQVIYTIN